MSTFLFPRRRGFSLIEAAIVLAITALVIGGIWAAYHQVVRSARQQEIAEMLLDMRQRLYQLTKDQSLTPNSAAFYGFTSVLYTDRTLVTPPPAGIPTSANPAVKGPSGLMYATYAQGDQYYRMVMGLDQTDCMWMLQSTARLTNTSSNGAPDTFLGNPSTFSNWCCSGVASLVAWGSSRCVATDNWISYRFTRDW